MLILYKLKSNPISDWNEMCIIIGCEKHIKKILEIFDSKEDIEAITKSIDNKLIAENDYNLSVSSYVEAKETRQETNIKELNDRIRKIVTRENELRTKINKIIAELAEDEL